MGFGPFLSGLVKHRDGSVIGAQNLAIETKGFSVALSWNHHVTFPFLFAAYKAGFGNGADARIPGAT